MENGTPEIAKMGPLGEGFYHVREGQNSKIFSLRVRSARVAPLKLRSGQSGPPAPLKGGQGKPLPLHPPSDASGIAQNC